MRGDHFHSNWVYSGNFYHHESMNVSASAQFEGSSDNGGNFPDFDHTANNNLNLHLHPQEGSPIGLTLRKSNSLINLVEMRLSREREQKKVETQPAPEKLKASNFPARLLQIGSWKRISRNEGDLVAKLYYAKKKLVWEFLDGPLKNKIEIQWSEISAIKAFLNEGEHGRLEIELNQPPQFGREINPQPRKHTQWKQTPDFTGGQASGCRRHSVLFPPGVLDKQYEKLLQCDNRLLNLSQQPFPVNNYPFFYRDSDNYCLDYSYHRPPTHIHGDLDSNSTNSQRIPATSVRVQQHFLPSYFQESWIPFQPSQVETIHEEIGSTRYENSGDSSFDQLRVNSGIGIQEPNLYGLPWDQGIEDLGSVYRSQHYNPNWT